MKKSYLLTCIGLVMSLLGFIPITHAQTYPYSCGFEDDAENAQWTFVITDDAPIFEDFNELDANEPNMGLGS